MKKRMITLLPTKIAYVGTNRSTCSQVKDVSKFKHNYDINYQGRWRKVDCNVLYLRETSGRVSEKGLDNTVRDSNSHLFKHSEES